MRVRTIITLALLASAVPAARGGEAFDPATIDFAGKVDLRQVRLLAIQDAGRAKIIESVADGEVIAYYGADEIESAGPVFSFLEVYFNAGAYLDKPILPIASRTLRDRLCRDLPGEQAEEIRRTGRVRPLYLLDARSAEVLIRSGRVRPAEIDLDRAGMLTVPLRGILQTDLTERAAAQRLLGRMRAFVAAGTLRVVPISPDHPEWLAPEDVATVAGGEHAHGLSAETAGAISELFGQLGAAWRGRDAEATGKLLALLCREMARRGGASYPSPARRRLEHQYNRFSGFTIVWIGYLAALVFLLASIATSRRGLRLAGIVVFSLSTLLVAAGFMIRWFLSGRGWLPPLTNQYESVVAVALLAAVSAIVLEAVYRRGLFAVAGSIVAGAALLVAFLQPGRVSADINAPLGLLNSPILAWHVATLILGYAMIGMSVVISLVYLVATGILILRQGPVAPPSSSPDLLAELDRFNLILIQLACWMVAVGVVLGAFWGDVAWGRWWGWDPKETWGLMTLLVYVGIVHVRHATPARTRGVWTAGLSIVGCAVMAFTWWGVSYAFRGLHSYA